MRGKNLKEWKIEDHIKPAEKVVPVVKKEVIELPKETSKKTLQVSAKTAPSEFNIDKLAKAVACHETKCGTK